MRSSSSRDMAVLLAVTLMIRVLTALPLQAPGYMDAYYYYIGAQRIVEGHGFTEPYIWNYLSAELTLPMPAFQYWQPLTSLVIVPFFALFCVSFRVAQIPMIILSSLLPLIAYRASFLLAPIRRRAIIAGLLVTFAPFYIRFWVTTDNFTPFALVAGLSLLAMTRALRENALPFWFVVAGGLVGLSHLTRADAPLLLVAFVLVALASPRHFERCQGLQKVPGASLLLAGLAYLAVLSPWLWHNARATGSVLGGTGLQTMFLRQYDDLYSYGQPLSWRSYLDWGWSAILSSKASAAGTNLITVIGVFLSFFLAPFAAIEAWARRRHPMVRLVVAYLVLLYLFMTLVFTFPGPRGSLLHSGAALLPFLLALAVHGLDRAVAWVAARRAHWDAGQAGQIFSIGSVALCVLFSVFLFARAVRDGNNVCVARDRCGSTYREVARWLDERGVPEDTPILVGDPPAFYYYTGRPSLAVPNEPPGTVAEVCRRFGARYVILDRNHPAPLDAFYQGEQPHAQLVEAEGWVPDNPEVKLYRCQPQ